MTAAAAMILGAWITLDILLIALLILISAKAGVVSISIRRPAKPRQETTS